MENGVKTIESNMLMVTVNDNTTLSEIRPIVENFIEINKNTVFDYEDKAGNKAARSHVAMLRKAKAPINDTHKRMTEEAKRFKDAADKDRRELIKIIDEMIEVHAEPIRIVQEKEDAEIKRQLIEHEISECWDMAHAMNAMFDRQKELERQAEEQARIAAEQEAEQRRIQIEKEKREAAERAAEEARLAEQARAARAIEEAREAERRAKEDAERKIKEAEERAAREKAEAEARAKAERERAEAAAKAEEERKRQEEERAKADSENIKRVHWLIVPALVAQGITEEQAKTLIMAIRDGKIPAVSIDYQWK